MHNKTGKPINEVISLKNVSNIRNKMSEKYTTPYPARRIHSDGRAEDTEVLLAKECPVKLFSTANRLQLFLPPRLN